MKKITLIAVFVLCAALLLCSCKSNTVEKEPSGTISATDDGVINIYIKPSDDKQLASDTAQYKPNDGYTYEKSENTIAAEDVDADGYLLNDEEGKNNIASVYYERGEESYIEIDIQTKDVADADIKSAIDMTRSIILSAFDKFPLDEIDGQLPVSLESVKSMIKTGEHSSNAVYGQDTSTGVSYEYYPESGALIFHIDL